MKTTLTLDPEVAEKIRAEVALGKRSVKEIVNQALKHGLGIETEVGMKPSADGSRQSSADPPDFNHVYDELLIQDYLEKTARYRKDLAGS